MEGIEELKEKLKTTLLSDDVNTSISTDVSTSKSTNVRTSKRKDVKKSKEEFRHKGTLYLTAKQYEILEAEYTKRYMSGHKTDRYSIVGEAIEIAFCKRDK